MFRKFQIVLIVTSIYITTSAQIDSLAPYRFMESIDLLLEQLYEDDNGNDISEELLEILVENNNDKLNVNELSYEIALKRLHLSEYQYYQLQLYIEEHGQLASIYELDAIDGFSTKERTRLEPFLYVAFVQNRLSFFSNFFKKSKQSILLRYGRILERQAGYDTLRNNHYDGSPAHLCFRYTFSTQDKFSIKISGEKDPGEQFFRGKQKLGFDFYAGSMSIKEVGIIKYAVLGDYKLNFGQGLVMGNYLLSGRGGGPDAIRRFSTGIRAVAPTNESDFLRGGSLTLGTTKWDCTLFAGRQFGRLDNHYGTNITYRQTLFDISGCFVIHTRTDTSEDLRSKRLRTTFAPNGFTTGINYQLRLKHTLLIGDMAVTTSGKTGWIQTLLLQLTPLFKAALLFRHYDKGFTAPLGSSFGTTSNNTGETGIYVTTSWIASQHCEITCFSDYYRLTWPAFRIDAPVTGKDIGLSSIWRSSRNNLFSLKYTFREKSENSSRNVSYKEIQEKYGHKIRLQWEYVTQKSMKFKSGIILQLNHTIEQKQPAKGVLIFQDAAMDFEKHGLSVHIRLALFDTDSYNERLYAYEDDVYYAFTIGSYFYQGVREYLVIRYKYKWISAWFRISHTYYTDRKVNGSSLNQIDKPHKSELKLQIMFQL